MKRFFNNLFRKTTPTTRKQGFRPQFEALEDRQLMTTAMLGGGLLQITGTNSGETINVTRASGSLRISVSGVSTTFLAANVSRIKIDALGGNDTVSVSMFRFNLSTQAWELDTERTCEINGGAGADTLTGGASNDTIIGGVGSDKLFGSGGSDRLEGGADNDSLFGGSGADVYAFVGGTLGTDTIEEPITNGVDDQLNFSQFIGAVNVDLAVTTNQTVLANHLVLRLSSNTMIEQVIGSDFADTISGNSRNNGLHGRNGNDTIRGLAGNDTLGGGEGRDTLEGGINDDRLYGGAGNDSIVGGNGNDWMEAGTAAEIATGGNGTDWNAHIWAVDGTTTADVVQGGTGSCVLMSALAGASRHYALENNISYLGDFVYEVKLFHAGSGWISEQVTFDGTMVRDLSGNIMDPASAVELEFWTILYQRAYIRHFFNIDSMSGVQLVAFPGEFNGEQAIRAVTGDSVWTDYSLNKETMREQLHARQTLNAGFAGHQYDVIDVFPDASRGGNYGVRLYNPWGTDITHVPMVMDNDGFNDGFITMDWDDFASGAFFRDYTRTT